MEKFTHKPVLVQEIIEYLKIKDKGHYLDATVGAGGHAELILSQGNNIRITAIDQDESAIVFAKERLKYYGERVTFFLGNFADFSPEGDRIFDGIIADLGVSSPQLDNPKRGFSFRLEGDLDMRMNQSQPLTAKDIVNSWGEKDLADLFFTYGEERYSRQIARMIVQKRPFYTTTQLAEAIASCVPSEYRHGRIHPATRTFQALRIKVNEELSSLEKFLQKAPSWLKQGGRIAVISFHSLEDRIVKNQFRHHPLLKIVTKKPIVPSIAEKNNNPRSRSAKLRVAERISP
ncbi:MAG: 16S rRNA (cytosine(1402)-N(4))-methyltransferase RsmH [Geminocystis sp.]|nr:16S rRNA (cytosine(1402)-N(4))-methyltransferase RsmH [Geminocystis sp.]HIK37861.1 16S rRNA (cytosine(1402)-N(4))-methyltransferase RsmH [Geminocystis sp. M7585_C2015_104]MCS7146961.1 16S rRNA (cytosine(1402)-N(4))-methyltransferase RsmH [Geminocystis sp.]MCX8077273.1 16S rRNA (cytosine(1402)-N(4))-methyltransferase RsmH [Geminocystis sp.]MDW8115785.1 16S rRNA (cytosine(1402)-N(4))-methyltransferase RsmH [Geminocystis sp.]